VKQWAWKQKGGGKGGGSSWLPVGKRPSIRGDTSKVVWVGNLPDGVTFEDLKGLGGEAVWAEVKKNGTGAIGFKTREEAEASVESLRGIVLNEKELQVDLWETSKTSKPQASSKGSGKGWGKWQKPTWSSSKGKGKGKEKKGSIKNTRKVVWIGGLPEGVTYQELLVFGTTAALTPTWAEVKKNGTGCIGFKTSEEAEAAAPSLNGQMCQGQVVSCDLWEKKS